MSAAYNITPPKSTCCQLCLFFCCVDTSVFVDVIIYLSFLPDLAQRALLAHLEGVEQALHTFTATLSAYPPVLNDAFLFLLLTFFLLLRP